MLGGGMCAGVSLRDTPSPLYQDCFGAGSLARKGLPGTAHRPSWSDKRIAVQARPHFSTSTSSHMLFPAPGISSPCTKLLLVLQGPAQMSPPPPCVLNFPQPGVMETPGSHTPWGESPFCPVCTQTRAPQGRDGWAHLVPVGGGAAGTGRRQEKAGPRHPWRKFKPRDPLTGEGEAGCGFSSGCGGGPGSPLGCFAGRPWALELLPGATESQISPPGRCHSQEMAGPWKPSQGKPPLPASVGPPPPQTVGAGLGREGARGLQTPRPRGWEVRTKNSCAPPLTRGRPFSGCRKEAQRGEGHANPGQQPVPRGAEEPAAGPRAGRGAGECWDPSSTPGLGAPPPGHLRAQAGRRPPLRPSKQTVCRLHELLAGRWPPHPSRGSQRPGAPSRNRSPAWAERPRMPPPPLP